MKNSKRIISLLLIVAFLSAPLAQTAYAGSDYGASTWATHYLEVAAQVAAAVAINRLTNRVISKVQSGGPDGGPAFIQNWINFTTQSQYQGEGIFRAMLGNTNLCNYFSDDLKNQFNARPASLTGQNTRVNNLDSFQVRAGCTLPTNFNYDNYKRDFSGNGGWEAWSRLLEPQNNYYGSLFQSLDEVARQRALAETSNTNKAVAGKGYFGFGEKDCKVRVSNNCLVPGDIKTPSATVEQAVANALNSPTMYLSGSKTDVIATTAISALTTLVINRLFDLSGNSSEPDDGSGSDDFSIPSPERTAGSYKQEFCMAEDNISKEAGFWVKDNYPQAWSSFPVEKPLCSGSVGFFGYQFDGCGKSYCERVRDQYDKNTYPYSRCTETCMDSVRGAPAVGLPPGEFSPYPLPPPGGGGGGGGGTCADPGNTVANHDGDLQSAIDAVIASNPNGIADALNTTDNSFAFLDFVVQELQSAGFNATTDVLNGNDNPNTGDLIAVWSSGDSTIERYDAVSNAGAGDMSMQNAAVVQYTGDIPLSCAQ